MRWCRSSAVMRRAAADISSTGRSAVRAMTAPPAAASADAERDSTSSVVEIAAQRVARARASEHADLDDLDDAAAADDRHGEQRATCSPCVTSTVSKVLRPRRGIGPRLRATAAARGAQARGARGRGWPSGSRSWKNCRRTPGPSSSRRIASDVRSRRRLVRGGASRTTWATVRSEASRSCIGSSGARSRTSALMTRQDAEQDARCTRA